MMLEAEETQPDVDRYVEDLTEGRMGVEVFCEAMQQTHQEIAAEQALRDRSPGNLQVAGALRRLAPGR
jgi:hypothetical protein